MKNKHLVLFNLRDMSLPTLRAFRECLRKTLVTECELGGGKDSELARQLHCSVITCDDEINLVMSKTLPGLIGSTSP